MSIRQIHLDSRDVFHYRKLLNDHGFISANYYSSNGFDLKKMRELAVAGKLDALRCIIGKTIRWYYSETQAESARLRGELS